MSDRALADTYTVVVLDTLLRKYLFKKTYLCIDIQKYIYLGKALRYIFCFFSLLFIDLLLIA